MKSDASIKIVLNYKNESYSIEVQKYQKLKYVKQRAYKLFYPIKTDIDIKYNNKSLTSLLDQSIGMIFNEKSFVRLIIIPHLGVGKSIKLQPNRNTTLAPLNLNNKNKTFETEKEKENINVSTSRIDKKEMIKPIMDDRNINYEKKIFNKSVEKIKKTKTVTEKNINKNNMKINKLNYYEDLKLKVNGKKKLPPIKKESDNNIMNNKDNKDNIENNNDYDIIAFNNCSECITNITSEYCRNCNKFLCLNCANENHSNESIHKLIEMDDNEKINISRYKEELNKDLFSSFNNIMNTTLDGGDNNIDIDNQKNNFEKLNF